MKNKFHISSHVFDQFRQLTDAEKWKGIIGEPTSSPGFQIWERIKVIKNNIIVINHTKKIKT
jgi:hypothetical protein